MSLTETPDTVQFPEAHYVFIERKGPFQDTAPECWQLLHKLTPAIAAHNKIEKYFSLYNRDQQVYRAGVSLSAPPSNLPQELQYEKFPGGKYCRFILTGPYSQLPEASGRVFEIVREKKIPLRAGFNIENYVNDSRTIPEAEIVTEIMFPTV